MRFASILPIGTLFAVTLCADPVPVIFDTDMGNDIDDALALALLHALESRGEVKLIAVTITKDNPFAATYIDIVNHFYGRGSIPIGIVKKGKTPEASKMIQAPSERKADNGTLIYERQLLDGNKAADAGVILKQVLERAADQSVVVIQVGFSTNLGRLLATPGGKDLVARKVKLLSMMAGEFPTGRAEYNVKTDIESARRVVEEWPTPIVASGFEIGRAILYPARSIEKDFSYVTHHPIADAYRNYKNMPYDRETWDLTSVLYAVRADRGYFGLSQPGWIKVDKEGKTRLEPASDGRHRYLTLDEPQRLRALEAMIYLASQPPSPVPARRR
jgi:inosine-uridine nucleoside N-ribohydrolase